MYETIKKFLDEGGKCLLIEDGKPIGVVLTMEEYKILKSKSSPEVEKLLIPRINNEPKPETRDPESEIDLPPQSPPVVLHPIGEAMVKEMSFPGASAELDDINLADAGDVTLEDLGLDELPY